MIQCDCESIEPCGTPGEIIVLNSQSKVDSFQLTLPPSCNSYLGTIQIRGEITSLAKLGFLRSIEVLILYKQN